ncbi:hypothetical protein EHE19_015335 [Ruminiclostridium herbifermentans]|uniref:Uncharacterized protein n=1 Tax=Ruminiclostridium herbifermentans TaxID=2488810 RepID=A0A4V6YE62_9FIRM|nr:phosphopantetheine-binding protein [Ruminiclostridium herbifermentans]QNU66239.1 hypothetical protein EHE19_015335 [Ruminiclostridium herbifermentans]
MRGAIVIKEIRDKVIKLISVDIGIENANQLLNSYDNFTQLGMNSLAYIKLAVLIENEFDIEFEDEVLEDNYFSSFSELCTYIEKRMHKSSTLSQSNN